MFYNKNNLLCERFTERQRNANRPELLGVFFTKNKTVATDGFRLLEVSTDTSINTDDMLAINPKIMRGCEPFIAEIKSMKPHKRLPSIAISYLDDKKVEFIIPSENAYDTKMFYRIDGKFVDYEKIMPQGEPKAEMRINGKLLGELLEAMGEISPTHEVVMKIYGEDKPVYLEANNGIMQKARGLCMPMKQQ